MKTATRRKSRLKKVARKPARSKVIAATPDFPPVIVCNNRHGQMYFGADSGLKLVKLIARVKLALGEPRVRQCDTDVTVHELSELPELSRRGFIRVPHVEGLRWAKQRRIAVPLWRAPVLPQRNETKADEIGVRVDVVPAKAKAAPRYVRWSSPELAAAREYATKAGV